MFKQNVTRQESLLMYITKSIVLQMGGCCDGRRGSDRGKDGTDRGKDGSDLSHEDYPDIIGSSSDLYSENPLFA